MLNIRSGSVVAAAFLTAVVIGCSGGVPAPSPVATSASPQAPTPSASSEPSPTSSTDLESSTPRPTLRSTSAGYTDLPGWIVFEHFGQAPDGSSEGFDFDNRMIWLARADGTDLHELAPGTPAGKAAPDISPDGQTVAYSTWLAPYRVWTVPIDGGAPTLISTSCSGDENECLELEPAFSSDGQRIAFVHFDPRPDANFSEIGIRDLAGGQVEYLEETRFPVSDGYVAQPSWSPDGSEIVYQRTLLAADDQYATETRLFIVQADGSRVRELPRPVGEWAADPDWSPDGSTIVFSTMPNRETEGWGDFPGNTGIWTVSPDGANLTHLCESCVSVGGDFSDGWAPSWTSDGRIIVLGLPDMGADEC